MNDHNNHLPSSLPQPASASAPNGLDKNPVHQTDAIVDPPDFSLPSTDLINEQTDLTEIDLFNDKISQSYQSIARLASESSSKSDFFRQALETAAQAFSSPYAVVYIRHSSEVIEHRWKPQQSNPDFWKELVNGFLTNALANNHAQVRYFTTKRQGNPLSIALLASPIHNSTGAAIGVMVMVVRCASESHAKVNLTVIESTASLISCCAEQVGKVSEELAQGPNQGKVLSKVAGYTSRHELAFAITNNLRNQTGCDLVALGIIHHQKAKIISISGQSDVDKRSPDVAIIREVMEECYDMDGPVVYQQEKTTSNQRCSDGHRIHQQWHNATGNSAVASLCLTTETGDTTVISLKRKGHHPFTHEELEKIRELIEPYTGAFVLVDRANRRLLSHAYHSLRQTAQQCLRPQRWLKKSLIAFFMIFSLWFIFGSVTYRITLPGQVIPAKIRQISCPQIGLLKSVAATEGDSVKQNAILCVFDHEPLLLERTQLQAQWQLARLQEETARNRGEKADARIAHATQNLLQTKLTIIEKNIEQTFVRAPFDGMVVSGDLRQRVGEIMAQGEPLFEIAGSQGWMLQLHIPARDIMDLKPTLTGQFATHAQPQITHALQLTRIRPKAQLINAENVYLADAKVDINAEWIKTGMEGVAKIDVEPRPVWWVTFHRFIDIIRIKLWF